jgi:5-methylcytosine-specific restriction enzyme subunit McrC
MTFRLDENQPHYFESFEDSDAEFLISLKLFDVLKRPSSSGYQITANNVIGALQLPSGNNLHIKPKVILPNVFKMLSYVSSLYRPLDELVSYNEDSELYDVIAIVFAKELEFLLRAGLKQDYTKVKAEIPKIKGTIDFNKYVSSCSRARGTITCSFWELTLDHPINRIIVAAGEALLKNRLLQHETKAKLANVLAHIPRGSISTSINFSEFSKIRIDRTIAHYDNIFSLSKLILNSISFSDSEGTLKFPGFLIKMSSLFEKFTEKALLNHAPKDILLLPQHKKALDIDSIINCKPDMLFLKNDRVFLVADTKYKDFSKKDFNEADVYQMVTYLVQHNCDHGFLIYPQVNQEEVGLLQTIKVKTAIGMLNIHAVSISLNNPASTSELILRTINGLKLVS